MAEAYSKALDKKVKLKRVLGKIENDTTGPTVVFIAGMHGNEPSGVFALGEVLKTIEQNNIEIKGNFYAVVGNIKALEIGERYLDEDLNRIWTDDHIKDLNSKSDKDLSQEAIEQLEINHLLDDIINKKKGPLYFIDLHTTSSQTIPFTLVNDTLLNRRFVSQYPVPMILGIEEYLDGPLLSYINKLGYVAFGYESGQHDDLQSIEYHKAFIFLTLAYTKLVSKTDIDFLQFFKLLSNTSVYADDTYEIFDTHIIGKNEEFKMLPGFTNFQKIDKHQKLATCNGQDLEAPEDGHIFMPLYQSHGGEGYFIIRKIPRFFLGLSAVLRKIKMDRLITILPGVSVHPEKNETLLVNKKVARFFAKQFFHLLGYRSRNVGEKYLMVDNRETHSKMDAYPKFD